MDNDDRAEAAEAAISAFCAAVATDEEDALCDLLANLRHWADRKGYDYDEEDRRAKMHYEAETE